MPKCFISYASEDQVIAEAVEKELRSHGVDAFMAAVSLRPGDQWAEKIWESLRQSSWVVFLASKSACESPYVQQELGGAAISKKRIVPVVWKIGVENRGT